MRAGIYVRVSTLERAKTGYSIKEQTERLEKFVDAKGWALYKTYVDGGYSGANTDRPGLQEMLEDAKEGRIGAVVVYKLDRLSRSQKDTLEIIEDVLTPSGVAFVSVTESFDTGTPFGMAMVGLLSVFAQLERSQIAERTQAGVLGRAKEGKWHGAAFSPVGYSYENDELHIIEYEAMMLREAFELFNRRTPIARICTQFMEKGYRHRYGYFLAASLGKSLKNKLYAGYIEKDGELYKGRHTPIVSEEVFARAQKIFEERALENPQNKAAFKSNSALAGLLRCKRCGAKYCRVVGHVKNDGTRSTFYSCYSRNKKSKDKVVDPNCRNKIWRMEELDEVVFDAIRKLAIDPRYIEDIRAANDDDERPRQIELLEARIEDLSAQISRLSHLYGIGDIDMDEIREQIDPLTSERKTLRAQLAVLMKESTEDIEETIRVAESFAEVLEEGDLDGIRFVVEELIDRVVVDGEEVRIFWKFA